MSTVLKPFIELPYGTKFRYQGSEEVWVRTQHNVIAGWSPNLIQSGHQSLCAFCALEGDEDGNTLQTLVEVVGDQPAQQHQGEPVALPGRKLINAAVQDKTLAYCQAWNACLDEIAKLGPLYTHADPAEVERLRGQVNEWAGKWERAIRAGAVMEGQRNTLRAQLTEAHALFARILGKRDTCAASYWFEEIQALLSASAEPSAPVEIDERAEFEAWHADNITPNLGRYRCGRYSSNGTESRWAAWQARAALERK